MARHVSNNQVKNLLNKLAIAVVLSFLLCLSGDAANILVIPGNVNSHIIYFSELGKALSSQGHTVLLVAPSNARVPSQKTTSNFTTVTYQVPDAVPFMSSVRIAELMIKAVLSKSLIERFNLFFEMEEECNTHLESDCSHLFDDADLMQRIRGQKFDFAVMDALALQCYLVLPYSLGIPYAIFSISYFELLYRVPRLPSFVTMEPFTDEMTFQQRLKSMFTALLIYTYQPDTTPFISKYASHLPSMGYHDLMQKASLWLYLEDVVISYARPNMPNTVSVGDIMARPGKPLAHDIGEIVRKSSEGVIVVSLGSLFDHVPDSITKKLCEAFSNVTFQVIWKLNNPHVCSKLNNVHIIGWIPQNDLLANQNVRLFITHGGFNSVLEAVYHGKPMIVLPIDVDQPANAVAVAAKGYGIHLDLIEFTAQQLLESINKIVSQPEFTEQVLKASAILKDKKESPGERVSFLINHVIKHGDAHLRTGAFQLSLLEFLMFDIFFVFFVVLTILVFIFFIISCCLLRMTRRCCQKTKKIKTT